MTKCDWFPRAHVDTPEVNLTLFGHDVLYQVKIAHRNTARGNDEVTSDGLGEFLSQAFHRITRNSQALGFPACPSYCRFQEVAVTVADLPWSQRLVYVNYFVACPEYSYAG